MSFINLKNFTGKINFSINASGEIDVEFFRVAKEKQASNKIQGTLRDRIVSKISPDGTLLSVLINRIKRKNIGEEHILKELESMEQEGVLRMLKHQTKNGYSPTVIVMSEK